MILINKYIEMHGQQNIKIIDYYYYYYHRHHHHHRHRRRLLRRHSRPIVSTPIHMSRQKYR